MDNTLKRQLTNADASAHLIRAAEARLSARNIWPLPETILLEVMEIVRECKGAAESTETPRETFDRRGNPEHVPSETRQQQPT